MTRKTEQREYFVTAEVQISRANLTLIREMYGLYNYKTQSTVATTKIICTIRDSDFRE
jgi:hypothetical protein